MRYHLLVNLNFGIFNPKSVTFVYSQLSHNIRYIFLHQYTIDYTLNPLPELFLKKRGGGDKLCHPVKTHKKLNSGCLWGKEQHGWRTRKERIPFIKYLFMPFEFYTTWTYYLFLKICLAKLLPSVRYCWLL